MHSLLIHLPADLDPFERGDRFEDPLNRALRQAGRLGECTGGGSGFSIGPGPSDDHSFIDVDVKDRTKAAPVIAAVLKATDAPVGTLVGDSDSDRVLVRVTAAGPEVLVGPDTDYSPPGARLPWRAGEVLGYRLTADRWVLLHVHHNDECGPLLGVPDWCGPELPAADAVAEIVRRPITRYADTRAYFFPAKRVGMSVRLDPPRLLNARRVTPTGVSLPPRTVRAGDAGPMIVTPRWFDRSLRELFGLVPVDGAARLNHDLGLGLGHLHLAAWDAGDRRTTAAEAKALFYAHCGREWKPAPDPLRGSVPTTDRTRRFVAELKKRFRGREVWGWGTFRAAEGFVTIPVRARDFEEVRTAAADLGRACGVAVYDPQADRLAGPGRTKLLPAAPGGRR